MKPSLQLKLGHQLTMTPQLQQAIELLQLSSLELELKIQTALQNNPLLETEGEEETEEEEEDEASATLDTAEDSNFEESDQSCPETGDLSWERENSSFDSSNDDSDWSESERYKDREPSLRDHLEWQLMLAPTSEISSDSDKLIALALIDSISEDGYLTASIADIQASLPQDRVTSEEEIVAVLKRIHHFDPIGVGARNLQECLLIQVGYLPQDTPGRETAKRLLQQHFDLLAEHQYNRLKSRLAIKQEELQCVLQLIRSLQPRPGAKFGVRKSEYIIPDVLVTKTAGRWKVSLNREATPKLRLNTHYAGLIRSSHSSRDQQFLKDQLLEARWLIKSLHNRNETLLKVARALVDKQANFLEYGEVAMKPLTLQDIAEGIGMHESTVSRVTTQKYMHTPRGLFELKYFFSSQLSTTSGEECSSTAIRAFIKKWVADENRQKPLSDQKLQYLLVEKGVHIARRTVSKYREALGFPPSHDRRLVT